MRKTDYVSMDNAIMLEHFGYKPEKGEINNLMVYRYETVINPEIEKLYPNETDDGYYELTKEGGGEYDWDYVYVKDWVFDKQRYLDNELIAPTYFEAARFLQEKYNYLIVVKPFEGDFETPMLEFEIYHDSDWRTKYRDKDLFKTSDEALAKAVTRILTILRTKETIE